ncbi:MAG TPA: thioredoxin domain-containing protein [Steroidobacteraceae bacterium]|nr:thioredoxin domain-containing protein [Steroidobacteraceae bacterium]
MHGQPSAGPRNRLADESSPYLLQHAANPVDWHPWGDEAIARARELDRPILLSIGYSACHWCHVMAHESFEDEATAAVMNRLFVNVKVDREERPDLDKVYQLAHQFLTQRGGGWPLTMFLAPDDLTPFFGGTYFPKVPRYGMPAFADLLERVAAFYRAERAGVSSQNAALRGVFGELESQAPGADAAMTREPIAAALRQLSASFDPRFGGFGPAPKFPHAASLELLLRASQPGSGHPEPDLEARSMAVTTLRRMAEGGLFDQLGGGFCRYSVDPFWMIPHFEKMLYDNGPLLALCAQAAALTGDALLREAALATAGWALREMRAPGGGFYAALDADSEGHEGRFYVWQRGEVEGLLTPEEYRVVARRFGLDREPNFEGAWHLHGFVALDEVARETGFPGPKTASLLDAARMKLLAARSRRVRPGLDDKVLTAWNALMIRGLAISGRLLDEPSHLDAAFAAVDFLRGEAWRDGGLHAAWKDGVSRFPAYLDDHAFLLDALLEVLQARFRAEDLRFACEIADRLLACFADRERGGFWFTAEGKDPPLYRPKSFADESMASGNGVAAQALARLGWLTGDSRYLEAAEAAVRGALPSMTRAPQAHAAMLNALDEQLDPVEIVIIRGERSDAAAWLRQLSREYSPRRMAIAIPSDAKDLPQALSTKRARERTVAYVCRGPVCSEPLLDPGDIAVGAARP